jgi:hypothetical protein
LIAASFAPATLIKPRTICSNLIRCGIEREMARIEHVDFCLRHVAAIGFRLRELEGEVILTPDH